MKKVLSLLLALSTVSATSVFAVDGKDAKKEFLEALKIEVTKKETLDLAKKEGDLGKALAKYKEQIKAVIDAKADAAQELMKDVKTELKKVLNEASNDKELMKLTIDKIYPKVKDLFAQAAAGQKTAKGFNGAIDVMLSQFDTKFSEAIKLSTNNGKTGKEIFDDLKKVLDQLIEGALDDVSTNATALIAELDLIIDAEKNKKTAKEVAVNRVSDAFKSYVEGLIKDPAAWYRRAYNSAYDAVVNFYSKGPWQKAAVIGGGVATASLIGYGIYKSSLFERIRCKVFGSRAPEQRINDAAKTLAFENPSAEEVNALRSVFVDNYGEHNWTNVQEAVTVLRKSAQQAAR